MKKIIEKLKQRWQLKTVRQVILVLIIFSLAGMSCLYVRSLVFNLIGINSHTPTWLKTILWIVVDVTSYQILFLFYGFVLGQFEFVWRFEKKSINRVKKIFSSE